MLDYPPHFSSITAKIAVKSFNVVKTVFRSAEVTNESGTNTLA